MKISQRQQRVLNLLLAAFILFLVSTSFYWMETNTAPPHWDQSWYLETSERLFVALHQQGFAPFLDTLMHALWDQGTTDFTLAAALLHGHRSRVVGR